MPCTRAMVGTRTATRVKRADFPSLIEHLYAAGSNPDGWPRFLTTYADAVGGTTTGLLTQDIREDRGAVDIFVRFDPTWMRRYREYYSRINPWITQRKDLLEVGSIVTSQMICPDSQVLRSEYYADFLQPQGIFHGLRAVILREDSRVYALTTLRPASNGAFGPREIDLVKALMPHLQRTLQIRRRFADLERIQDAASAAFDLMAFGLILLDSAGRVLIINRSAREIIETRDGLSVGGDGLHAATSAETAQLRRLVLAAAATSAGRALASGGAINLSRPSMSRPLAVLVAPLGRRELTLGRTRAHVAVFVTDPERTPEGPPHVLQRLYSLTPAEARLVSLLMQGHTVEAAAEELAISPLTARTQLKGIFGKTGVRRQGDLLRLVLTGPAALRLD